MSRMKSRPGFGDRRFVDRHSVADPVAASAAGGVAAAYAAKYRARCAKGEVRLPAARPDLGACVQRSPTGDRRCPIGAICPIPSSPALPPRRPAFSTSAERARRCSTGSMRAAAAARCCCGSRTPTASAPPRRRSTPSSTGSPGSASIGMARPSTSSPAPRATARWRSNCWPTGIAYRCYATPEELTAMREKARGEGRTRLYDGRWRDRDPGEAPGRRASRRSASRRRSPARPWSRIRCRAGSPGRTRTSTISCCCARTAIRPTCSPWWSTTTTWASPTSSAATTT